MDLATRAQIAEVNLMLTNILDSFANAFLEEDRLRDDGTIAYRVYTANERDPFPVLTGAWADTPIEAIEVFFAELLEVLIPDGNDQIQAAGSCKRPDCRLHSECQNSYIAGTCKILHRILPGDGEYPAAQIWAGYQAERKCSEEMAQMDFAQLPSKEQGPMRLRLGGRCVDLWSSGSGELETAPMTIHIRTMEGCSVKEDGKALRAVGCAEG